MYATAFEFNGIKSEDVGFYIFNYNGFSNDGIGVAGSEITFNTSKPPYSKNWNFYGSKYETQLSFNFQIGKINCNNNINYELTQQDCAFLMRWLVRSDNYKYLRFFQNGYEDTYFHAQINLQWIRVLGKIVGAELAVTCDAPYGYSKIKNFEIDCADGESFQIYDDSDEVGAINFDKVEILMTSNSEKLQIVNDMENKYSPSINNNNITIINNCYNGEKISITNRQIKSDNDTKHTNCNINEDFNFKYPRLINLSDKVLIDANNSYGVYMEERINTYTVTGGSCHLFFSYRTIRKVLP